MTKVDFLLYVCLLDLVLGWIAIRVKRRRVREELADEVAVAFGEDQLTDYRNAVTQAVREEMDRKLKKLLREMRQR